MKVCARIVGLYVKPPLTRDARDPSVLSVGAKRRSRRISSALAAGGVAAVPHQLGDPSTAPPLAAPLRMTLKANTSLRAHVNGGLT